MQARHIPRQGRPLAECEPPGHRLDLQAWRAFSNLSEEFLPRARSRPAVERRHRVRLHGGVYELGRHLCLRPTTSIAYPRTPSSESRQPRRLHRWCCLVVCG